MHPLLKQHQHSLIGRIRAKILMSITDSDERLPTDQELWREQMKEWKQNPEYGRIIFHILHLEKVKEAIFPSRISRQQVRATLRNLAKNDSIYRLYVEGKIPDSPNDEIIGCLVLGHEQLSGEPGYYAVILREDAFPSCGYISIVPSLESGQSRISVLSPDGWHDLTPSQVGSLLYTRIALTALQKIPDSEGKISVPIKDIFLDTENLPPEDPECARRLNLVMRKKMFLTEAIVHRTSVRLFSRDFVKKLSADIIQNVSLSMQNPPLRLLVYWDKNQFVSSDDYYPFLAYELLEREQLPVVIMGEFPENAAHIMRQGGYELMPPVLISKNEVILGATDEFRVWHEEEKLLRSKRLPPPSELMAKWIVFAEMLAREDENESVVHNYLEENPVIMGAYWDTVESKVRLDNTYITDFVLSANRALPTVCLVELERCTHRLFTKDLHETDEVTHAVQQVNDWIRWWRQNPSHPLVAQSRGVVPDGQVIIGRSIKLTDQERETLAHNNQGRNIKVITYDELLDNFGTLILHRLSEISKDGS